MRPRVHPFRLGIAEDLQRIGRCRPMNHFEARVFSVLLGNPTPHALKTTRLDNDSLDRQENEPCLRTRSKPKPGS